MFGNNISSTTGLCTFDQRSKTSDAFVEANPLLTFSPSLTFTAESFLSIAQSLELTELKKQTKKLFTQTTMIAALCALVEY